MLSLKTDINDLILQRTLYEGTLGLNNAINRMTTGLKVNHAKDNAAGYSIIENLNTRISSMLQVQSNTEDGISLLSTAQGGLEEIQSLLKRLRELAVQASNETLDSRSRNALQAEADALVTEIERLKSNTKYDGINLFETPSNNSNNIATAAVMQLARSASFLNNADNLVNDNKQNTFIPSMSALTNEEEAVNPASSSSFYSTTNWDDTEQPLTSTLSQGDGARTMMRSAAPASTIIEGAVDFTGYQTQTITIDGVNYTVTNKLTTEQSLSYVKDTTTGQIEFRGSDFTIKAQTDVSHNLVINGSRNDVYGGNLADTIVTSSNTSDRNKFYGLKGDDILTIDSLYGTIYGEEGDDKITSKGSEVTSYGGIGKDTFYLYNATYTRAYGGNDNDTFYIYKAAYAIGEDGDDEFIVQNGAYNAIIDGGAGSNTISDNGSKTVKVNVPGENAFVADFEANETKTLTIKGVEYTVTNLDTIQQSFICAYETDGSLNFKTRKFKIVGDENVAHNVKLSAAYIEFHGSNLADNINITANYAVIFAKNGNDTISSSAITYINAGGDDDTISLGTGCSFVLGGEGDDTVKVTSTTATPMLYDNSGTNTIVTNNGKDELIFGFGADDNAQAIELAGLESKNITINGIDYTVKNSSELDSVLLYSVNSVTGEVSFGGYYITITGDVNKQHNVSLYGYATQFIGGKYADTIIGNGSGANILGKGGDDNIVLNYYGNAYGGDGLDTITSNTHYANIYGDADNDTIIINNGTNGKFNGGAGNDIYEINASATTSDTDGNNIYYINTDGASITGSPNADSFYVAGSNNTVFGAGGDDYFVIDGSNNTIDGGTGTNYYVNNGAGNSYSLSEIAPSSGSLLFTYQGETRDFVMDGKTYTVVNNASGSNQFTYSYNANTKLITVSGDNFGITSASGQANNLNIRGSNNIYNGSSAVDRITIESGSNNVINGNNGNDTLISNSENNSILGGAGNDTITLNASTNLVVDAGAGADVLNVNSANNTQISAGAGDDRINVSGTSNTIKALDGNNKIAISGDSNNISADNGNNSLVVTSDDNTIVLGNGNNTLGIAGDENNVTAQKAVGTVNIVGDLNTITQTQGANNVVIKGSGNNYTSVLGQKEMDVVGDGNTIITGTENDEFNIKGSSNTLTTTGGDNEIEVNGNNNQIQTGEGLDKIKLTGDSNIALSGDGNDEFTLVSGENNTIDGEGGNRNVFINYTNNLTSSNAYDITPKPFKLSLKVGISSSASSTINTEISFNPIFLEVDLSTAKNARESIASIDETLLSIDEQLLNIGSLINRLEFVLDEQLINIENMISTRSTLRDADIAEESSNYIKYQILQEASSALLASSRNLRYENAIGLLQGLKR